MATKKVLCQGNKVLIKEGEYKDKFGVVAGMGFNQETMEVEVDVNLMDESKVVTLEKNQMEVVEE